jgi:hypothetical protein
LLPSHDPAKQREILIGQLIQEVLKLKRHSFISLLTCVFGLSLNSHAQAIPAASRNGTLQLGVGGTIVSTDYTPNKAKGLTVYGDFDFTKHIGLEGDIHFGSIITPGDLGEDSYILGPRYVVRRNPFNIYAKALFGIGRLNYQFDNLPHASFTYKIYSLGGGVDIRATRSINIRAIDVEFQRWPGYQNGLAPIVTTIGVAYSFP